MVKKSSKLPSTREPLWKGPEIDGITVSLLNRFLVCRERFRLLVVEGLRPAPIFQPRIEYGQMWHVCEESFAKGGCDYKASADIHWIVCLTKYTKELCRKYPLSQPQIQHWYHVCLVQFPLYVQYWNKRKPTKSQKITPVFQEQVFKVPVALPSGRVVWLRGKWDEVHQVGGKLRVKENKTKSDLDEQQLSTQLQFDLQTMTYVIALQRWLETDPGDCLPVHVQKRSLLAKVIEGVDYNTVRRPLAGGKHSIRLHQAKGKTPAETDTQFYTRLSGLIQGEPEYFFSRWTVYVTHQDQARFASQCLDPLLETVCDWWDSIKDDPFNPWVVPDRTANRAIYKPNPHHWRHPYGVYNVLNEGGSSEVDEYLKTGSTLGLVKAERLFTELEPDNAS